MTASEPSALCLDMATLRLASCCPPAITLLPLHSPLNSGAHGRQMGSSTFLISAEIGSGAHSSISQKWLRGTPSTCVCTQYVQVTVVRVCMHLLPNAALLNTSSFQIRPLFLNPALSFRSILRCGTAAPKKSNEH